MLLRRARCRSGCRGRCRSTRTPPSASSVTHDPVAVAGQRLVDGVVDDLPDQVVQAALAGGADVHARTLADRLEALEDLDRAGVVRRRAVEGWPRPPVAGSSGSASTVDGSRSLVARRCTVCRRVGTPATWSSLDGVCAHRPTGRPTRSVYPSAARNPRVPSRDGGDLAPEMAAQRLRNAARTRLAGVRIRSLYVREARRSASRWPAPARRSAVGVARARARRPGRPARASSAGRAGPSTSITATVPSPRSSLSRRTTVGREQPHLGRPRRRVGAHDQPAVGVGLGRQCGRDLAPTIAAQRANTPCTRRSVSQPWSVTSRPRVDVEQLRVAVVGVGAGDLRVDRGGAGRLAAASAAAPRGRARPAPRATTAGEVEPALVGSPPAARGSAAAPAAAAPQSVNRRHLPVGHREPRARAAPRARRRRTAAVTSTCSAPATSSASRARRPASSSANTSSRISTGSSPSAAQQLVRRQPQRQRERPRLAVAGVALDGQRRPSEQHQVVAVRADQGDAALELVAAARARARREQPASVSSSRSAASASSNDGL